MLSAYQHREADSTTVCTDRKPDMSNGATTQSTTLFGGAEEISPTGLAVDTTADSSHPMDDGRDCWRNITAGAE